MASGEYMARRVTVSSAGLTECGPVRKKNEDSVFLAERPCPGLAGTGTIGIYLIADGLGGHPGGEIASNAAMRTISGVILEYLGVGVPARPVCLLREAIERAHRAVLALASSEPALRSMGTTVTVGLRLGLDLYLGHVGDSRAYLARDRSLRQLTEDHSVIADLLRQGSITSAEARRHPDRGQILRCLGVTQDLAVDTHVGNGTDERLALRAGDRLLFCSDGLTDAVADNEILDCIQRYRPSRACRRLLDLANARGGTDNASVIAVRVG